MFNFASSLRIHLCLEAVDMRKAFNGLYSIAMPNTNWGTTPWTGACLSSPTGAATTGMAEGPQMKCPLPTLRTVYRTTNTHEAQHDQTRAQFPATRA